MKVRPLRYDYHWSAVGGNAGHLDTFEELDSLAAKWSRPYMTNQYMLPAEREYNAHGREEGLLP